MSLDDLARRLNAFENIDKHPFQRMARVLQSMWRERKGYPIGSHRGRSIGNYLEMPWAEESRSNFLDDENRTVVRREVDDEARSRGKLFGRPRLYDNLLSSQPLAFNLFAHLAIDLELASKLVAHMTAGAVTDVTAIEFEHSPGRSDPHYTNDRSAFDVYLRTKDRGGSKSFIGIEVKYHEDLAGQGSGHQPRYDEIAGIMGCFRP